MTFKRDNCVQTRFVCGYNPCYNKNPDSSTTYQQHRCSFINQRKDLTCPQTKFCKDLVSQLWQWQQDGDKLIVCLDANEGIYPKLIGKALTDLGGLRMKEVVGDFTQQRVGATFFRCSKPINGVWVTSDILVTNACIMPVGYGIGDHCLFVINFSVQDIIRQCPPHVVRATSHCLNTRLPRVAAKYVRILEAKVIEHQLIEQVGKVHKSSRSRPKVTKHINKIDREIGDYMHYVEKKCLRIKSGRIPFSPKASLWIKQTQIYCSLLKYHAGKIRNQGNLKQAAR
jgi:hypothetical protein